MLEASVAAVNRRQFLVTKLSAGFALAVLPVSAKNITTDTEWLDAASQDGWKRLQGWFQNDGAA